MKFKVSFTLTAACFIFLLFGCKKNKIAKDEISFTYNGKNYNYTYGNSYNGVNVYNGFYGTPAVEITLPDFDGKITFEKTGCAYYLPKLVRRDNILPGCVISYSSVQYNTLVDSSKIYQYSSGFLNITTSNCKISQTTFLGFPVTHTNCDVNGFFDLTLTNRNNEKIVITNGIVKLHAKLM